MTPLGLLLAAENIGEGCGWTQIDCWATQAIQDIMVGAGNSALQGAADVFMTAWAQLEMFFLASWILMPPLVDITATDGTTSWLQSILGSLTFAAAVMGALITAGWTFLRLRSEKVKTLGWRLAVLLVVSTSGALIIAAADHLIRMASVGILFMVGITPTGAITSTVVTNTAMAVSPGITLIIGIVAVIGVLIQWVIMIARGPLVVLLVGIWPFTAAAATLGVQKAESAFDNITAWLIAFVIYPFPAALVYAAAFRLKGGADGLGGIMYGLVLEVMAVLLMPAIFRIIAPHTKALGEKWGGKVAVDTAVSVAETALTVGAAVVTAGAAAGAIAAKAGTTAAKAGAEKATTSASSSTGNSTFPGPSAGSDTADASTSTTAPGADVVGNEQGAPPSGAQSTDSGAATPPPTDEPPAAGSPSPAPQKPAPSGSGNGAKAEEPTRRAARVQAATHAATQAAQVTGQSAGRAARKAVDDMDDIIGGKQ